MNIVQLKDGTIEIIGCHRDLVDIIREKCGDDVAKLVEENDPADWEDVCNAECKLSEIEDILYKKDDDGLLTADQVEEIADKLEIAIDYLLRVV